jgi:hypothetical protein
VSVIAAAIRDSFAFDVGSFKVPTFNAYEASLSSGGDVVDIRLSVELEADLEREFESGLCWFDGGFVQIHFSHFDRRTRGPDD